MSSTEDPDRQTPVLDAVRRACGSLPEVVEESAWVGTRWRVRGRTFAHVLTIEGGKPNAYAEAAGTVGPAVVLMFRSSGDELDILRRTGNPFFAPVWRDDEVGLIIGADNTDIDDVETIADDEITELVTDSYCLRAPAVLVAQVDRPVDPADT